MLMEWWHTLQEQVDIFLTLLWCWRRFLMYAQASRYLTNNLDTSIYQYRNIYVWRRLFLSDYPGHLALVCSKTTLFLLITALFRAHVYLSLTSCSVFDWDNNLSLAASCCPCPDMIFVQNFTPPDFQARNFTPQKCVICDIYSHKLIA